MTIRRTDYFAKGDYNAICDGCGGKLKASQLTKDWQGFMKCVRCWEPRQPQDFARSRNGPEPSPVPFVRGELTPLFVNFCTPAGVSSLPDTAVPDCWIVELISPMYDPNVTY